MTDLPGLLEKVEAALERALLYMGNPTSPGTGGPRNSIILDVSQTLSDVRDARSEAASWKADAGATLLALEGMRAALEPFAKAADEYDRWQARGSATTPDMIRFAYGSARMDLEDFRRARAALTLGGGLDSGLPESPSGVQPAADTGQDDGASLEKLPPGPVNCTHVLRREGKPYPRTCERCRLGPCPFCNNDGTVKP